MVRHEALKPEMDKNGITVCDNYPRILDFSWDKVREINVRIVVTAASLHDDIEATRKMGPLLGEGGSEESKVFMVRGEKYHSCMESTVPSAICP
jgi:hypothetical protein